MFLFFLLYDILVLEHFFRVPCATTVSIMLNTSSAVFSDIALCFVLISISLFSPVLLSTICFTTLGATYVPLFAIVPKHCHHLNRRYFKSLTKCNGSEVQLVPLYFLLRKYFPLLLANRFLLLLKIQIYSSIHNICVLLSFVQAQ